MLIVNPLYDHAFKYLMQNDRMAKKVLSVILDQDVTSVELGHQEVVVPDVKRFFTLYRLDFKAEITDPDGRKHRVLIELQKSKFDTDIQRFRNYLGANYMSHQNADDETDLPTGDTTLPIITIYILGYKLADVPHLAVTVNRHIIDSVSKATLQIDSQFINHLTHRSHIIQVRRLPKQRQSRLEQFLVFFNQAWVSADKNYIIDLQDVPEEYADMATYLQTPAMDAEFRRRLEVEDEIDSAFDMQERRLMLLIEEERRQKEEERRQKESALQQKEEERKQKEEAQNTQKSMALKMALMMKQLGKPANEIARETGLPEEEIISL